MIEQLDFADFRSNDEAKRYEFGTKFVSTLKQYGFARLVNHGVSSSDIDKAFETV
jgi:isopenicillin N synthase-like dioxygenase